jgi:hypothetical protein
MTIKDASKKQFISLLLGQKRFSEKEKMGKKITPTTTVEKTV